MYLGGVQFRVAPVSNEDSDDDPTPQNSAPQSPVHLVRVLPMPINGTRNFNATYSPSVENNGQSENENNHHRDEELPANNNIQADEELEVEENGADEGEHLNQGINEEIDDDDDAVSPYNDHHQVRRKNISYVYNSYGNGTYSSHSNSRLSSSSDDDDLSSNDSCSLYYKKIRKKIANGTEPTSTSTVNHNNTTPSRNECNSTIKCTRTNLISQITTPDSGIVTTNASCSSSAGSIPSASSTSINNNNGSGGSRNGNGITSVHHSSIKEGSDSASIKLFKQRVAQVRRNYRNHFGDDSDSD